MSCMVFSPKPLGGLFTVLSKAESSDVLTDSLRYAITSLTSALSKNLNPPNILYGILLEFNSSSNLRDKKFDLYNSAISDLFPPLDICSWIFSTIKLDSSSPL